MYIYFFLGLDAKACRQFREELKEYRKMGAMTKEIRKERKSTICQLIEKRQIP